MQANTPASVRRRLGAFTLIEVLIVVLILAVLAVMVIPQFANASEDARRTSMRNQLQTLRATIGLYRVEHLDAVPQLITEGWPLFTSKTLSDGTVDPAGKWGPYLYAPPVNPLTNSSEVVPVGTAASPTNGWFYDETTGEVHGADRSGAMSDTGE